MKLIVLLFSALALTTAAADSLDFSRQAVVVLCTASDAATATAGAVIADRALAVFKAAVYDRDQTVESYLAANPQAQRRLDRAAWSGTKSGTSFLSNGTVTETYTFPLTGPALQVILPPTGNGRLLGRALCPCCGQPWPEGKEPPPGVHLVPAEDGSSQSYTGILIDLRGLNARPALFPKVVTESDKEVIGPGFALPEKLAESGQASYYRSRVEALTGGRVGPNPLVITALGMTGTNRCDAVITQSDAARIHGSRANLDLLSNCKVGFLVD